jgi:hypothetical protein
MIKASALVRDAEQIKSTRVKLGLNIDQVLDEIRLMLNTVMGYNRIISCANLIVAIREYILYIRDVLGMPTRDRCCSAD